MATENLTDRRAPRRRRLLAVIPVVALALCLYAVPLPLFVEAPGPARDVLTRIDVDGAPTYPAEGRLLLTTVNLGRVSAFHALRAWLDPAANLLGEREVLPPGQTQREYERITLSQMDQSKLIAAYVVLERLTQYPKDHGPGALIYGTEEGTPAAGRLFPGDLVIAANGRPLGGQGDLRRVIDRTGPRGQLRLTVEPVEGGEERTVRLRPIRRQGDTLIGVLPLANFPFHIFIQSGDIAGPSGGLMWALGIYDLLTPGELTGGRRVAGTGTLDFEGQVGPIGGIGLKVRAAENAGASLFLVPRKNMAEARDAVDEIELVPVSSLGQVIRFLEGDRGTPGESDP